jgi:uncharacterized protein YutE (UPF0331/DUF86 family)
MPQFDQEKLIRLVSEMRKSIARLKSIGSLSQDSFLKDPDKIGSAKYHFIVAIESAIDICNHIISRNGYRVPEDYGDTFGVMNEQGVFGTSFTEELKKMAKFRNRLVHLYWELDDSQAYKILQTRLDDFKIFLDAIARYLDWRSP